MKPKHYFFVGLGVALLVTGMLSAALLVRPYTYQGSLINPPMPVGDVNLTDQHGRPFDLSALLDGEVRAVLVFFGYANCPDVCPITLVEFKQIKERLGADADKVRFVFITVDPERDTPERLQRYMALYDESFIGLTGERAELEPVWKRFGVYQARQDTGSAASYLVDHTSYTYVLDANGEVGLTFGFSSGVDAMLQDLRYLLRQK